MAAVLERTQELGVLRAVGMSRPATFGLMILEALLMVSTGGVLGLLIAWFAGPSIQDRIRPFVPLAPDSPLPMSTGAIFQCLLLLAAVGAVVGMYPAWRASRLAPAVALKVD